MKSIRYAIAALLLVLGVAGVAYSQDYGYDEPPAQQQAAPKNPVQAKYADGKLIVVVHSPRHYGYRLGDRVPVEIIIVSDPSVTINVDGITHGVLSQTGSDFELVSPATVRTEQQDGKNITIVNLTLRSWVTVDQSSGAPKNNIGFTADFLFATGTLPDGRPQWVPATTPEFIVTTSNTATESSKDLEMGDVDQQPYPNPTTVTPLRIAGGLLLLIPLGWLCFLVYRRLNPPREVPANEKAWIAFDRILRESEGAGGISYDRTAQIAHALRAYLDIESVPLAEVQGSLETFFKYDEDKRYELTRVAQEALAILDRALYERPADENRTPVLSNGDARDLFARIDRVVPRP
jgi:hypothetical protein